MTDISYKSSKYNFGNNTIISKLLSECKREENTRTQYGIKRIIKLVDKIYFANVLTNNANKVNVEEVNKIPPIERIFSSQGQCYLHKLSIKRKECHCAANKSRL